MLVLQDCLYKLAGFKKDFGSKFGIVKLGIFGSVARRENTEGSDIDIVVEVQQPTLSLMYELKNALKALFGCDVDLVRFRETLRPLFKANIQRDVIYVGQSLKKYQSYFICKLGLHQKMGPLILLVGVRLMSGIQRCLKDDGGWRKEMEC